VKLKRIFQNTYQQVTSTILNRGARAMWETVATLLWALLRKYDFTLQQTAFFSDALLAVGDGTTAVKLNNGMGLWWDSTEADSWTGGLKPFFLDADTTVTVTTNNDASGNDRIDLICIKAVLVDDDSELVYRKSPTDGTVAQEQLYTSQRWTVDYQVVEGTPAAAPAAPAAPTGWTPIAQVDRPNGQAGVNDVDITDLRNPSILRLSDVHLRRLYTYAQDQSEIGWLDANGSVLDGFLWSNTNQRITTRSDKLEVGSLYGGLFIPTAGGDYMVFCAADGSVGAGKAQLESLRPDGAGQGYSRINIEDSSGNAGAGFIEGANAPRVVALVQVDNTNHTIDQVDWLEGFDRVAGITRAAAGQFSVELSSPPASAGDIYGYVCPGVASVPTNASYSAMGGRLIQDTINAKPGATAIIMDHTGALVDDSFFLVLYWTP